MSLCPDWADLFRRRTPLGFIIIPGAVAGMDGRRHWVRPEELWWNYEIRPLGFGSPQVLVLPGCFTYEPEPDWWLTHELPRARDLWPDFVPLTPRPASDYDLMAAVMRWARWRQVHARRRLRIHGEILDKALSDGLSAMRDVSARLDAFEATSRHGRFA